MLNNIRKANSDLSKWTYDRIPVIIKHDFRNDCFKYEVDFWTPEMIDNRVQVRDGKTYHYAKLLQTIEHGEGEARIWLVDWVNPFDDRFVVNTECQPDYFKTIIDAFEHFKNLQ